MCENGGGYSFHRLRAVPLPRGGRSLGRGIGSWQNVGGCAMRELLPPPAFTPSTACGRSPSLEEGGLWGGESGVGRMSAGARCANSFHRCGGPPPSKREVFGEGNRELAECRRVRDARTPSTACGRSPSLEEGGLWGGESGVCRMSAGNCNCEMRLQRWVASLQRLDAFATVGCTAVHRRGAHCAPVYLRCYNNLSSGRAKGHRGDRKAPICNRRQGRRH